jgi:2'-5' RNA ligase
MTIKLAGVAGCGIMGSGIAQVCASHGYEVRVLEVDQERLDRALAALGFPAERYYVPHVTLGRVRERDPGALRALQRQLESAAVGPLSVQVRELVLMESRLRPEGPTYLPLFRVGLG